MLRPILLQEPSTRPLRFARTGWEGCSSSTPSRTRVLGIAWFYISGWDRWGGTGDGETDAPPPYDGIPDAGYVWGYLTDVTAADIWNLEGIVNPFAPVVGVLVE